MALCNLCKSLDLIKLSNNKEDRFAHHKNHKDLLASRDQGCPLCALFVDAFRQGMDHPGNGIDLRLEPYSVHGAQKQSFHHKDAKYLRSFSVTYPNIMAAGSLSVYADEEWPAARSGDIVLRPVAPAEDMTFARSCLSHCLREHKLCHFRGGKGYAHKAEASKPVLPTRVVDVGPADMPLNASLLETTAQRDYYLTLSYCWGKTEMVRTTVETLSKHKKSIPLNTLPKTIRDALVITKEFGYRYIWIDSLCIIQGSTDDWEKESSQMARIYRHSTLTIAASGAHSADEGCFLPRKPIPTVQIAYYTRDGDQAGHVHVSNSSDMPSMYRDVVNGPLSRRAWALQESFLSRRVLFYGKGSLHWSCDEQQRSGTRNDDTTREKYHRLGKPPDGFDHLSSARERPWRGGRFGWHQELYREWYKMIGEYTTRALTDPGDKLPALAGVTSNVAQHTGDRYVAGLWERDFGFGLLWKGVGKSCVHDENNVHYGPKYQRPPKWRAPTWSWASLDGETNYPDSSGGGEYERAESMLEDVKIHVQMSKMNRFGGVVSGGVTLTGLVKQVKILIGSHSTCDVLGRFYTEEEIMRSIETGVPLTTTEDEEKTPYEPCNLHEGYNSEMYDEEEDRDANRPPDLPLTSKSPSHIGSASIDEPTELARRPVAKRPFHLLLVQRVHHKPWQGSEGEGEGGWNDYLGLVLQGTGKKDKGTVFRRVGMAGLREDLPEDWVRKMGKRRITIV